MCIYTLHDAEHDAAEVAYQVTVMLFADDPWLAIRYGLAMYEYALDHDSHQHQRDYPRD